MHSPRFLIVIGALSFGGWLLWLNYTDGARESVTLPNVTAAPYEAPGEEPAANDPPASPSPSVAEARARAGSSSPQPRNQETPRAAPAYAPPGSVAKRTATESTAVAAEGNLSIAGRLLNLAGDPVPGMDVTARSLAPDGRAATAAGHRGRSDDAGSYEIQGLTPGDYDVRTVATAGYASAGKTFRAGLESADIVLAGSATVQVYGRVTDANELPLAGVEISPGGADAVRVWTDAGGNYRTQLTVANPAASYTVSYRLAEYLDERVNLQGRELVAAGEFRVDVELRALNEATTVTGTLRSQRGDVVPGETVQLHSAALGTRYMATSRGDGTFSMSAVEPASDYRVTIHPKGTYENYWQQGIVIGGAGASLDIMLQALDSGRLTGRIIDVEGYPLPGFSLLLKSNKSQRRYVTVTSDEGGYFVVEDAPAGNLMFVTRSDPRFVVSGISLEAGSAADAEVIIDWGDHEFGGRVRDERSGPVAGAKVQLNWKHAHGGIQSTSLRSAVTDGDGFFRFTQLGPGPHQLDVVASGYQRLQQAYNVDAYLGEIRVELRKASQ